MAPPNNYDQYAAARQKDLRNGVNISHRFVEKPAMKSVLPDLAGKRVLMLGCGTGEESKLLEESGCVDMMGLDISKESVRLANESYPQYQFVAADMHRLPFEDGGFDFVYSSLAVHYSDKPLVVYQEVHRVLKPGGSFQFSVGHPIRWAVETVAIEDRPTRVLGYSEGKDKPKLYGNYHTFSRHQDTFSDGMVVEYWIGAPSLHFKLLKQSGFMVEDFIETQAIEECRQTDPNFYERFNEFPQWCVFVAKKG